ncbi:hypothetical protein V8E36_007367 [Tilletia maclaganii]
MRRRGGGGREVPQSSPPTALDAREDHDDDQRGAVPSLFPHPRDQDMRMDTDDAFADEDAILAQFVEINPTRYVAISIYSHPDDGLMAIPKPMDWLYVTRRGRTAIFQLVLSASRRRKASKAGKVPIVTGWRTPSKLLSRVLTALEGCAQPWTWPTFVHTQGPEARRGVVDVFTGSTEIQLRLHGSRLRLPGRGILEPFPVRATGIGL